MQISMWGMGGNGGESLTDGEWIRIVYNGWDLWGKGGKGGEWWRMVRNGWEH